MTKFVAAAFLPLVCAAAAVVRPSAWVDWRPKWRDWLAPAAATVLLIAPWFVYQTLRDATSFWHVILMEHVVTRFAAVLIPSHLHPWHFYLTELWKELHLEGSLSLILLGVAVLAWRAAPAARVARRAHHILNSSDEGQRFLARLLWLWWLLPVTLISLGTSKLLYYAYPFLPPLSGPGLPHPRSSTGSRAAPSRRSQTPTRRSGRIAPPVAGDG
jgi:hypothetical protein